jgi:hypothetical protein
MIPNQYNPVDFDRYAYVNNNPVKSNDPSGHASKDADGPGCSDDTCRIQANVFAVFAFESRHNNTLLQIVIPETTIGANQVAPTTMGPNPSGPVAGPLQSPQACTLNPTVTWTNEDVGQGLDLFGNGLDVIEAASGKSIPGLGLAVPAYAQAIKDYGKGFNDNQKAGHTGIVLLESAGTSYVISVIVPATAFAIPGPGWVVGGITAVVVVIISSRGFDDLNKNTFFPAADKLLK